MNKEEINPDTSHPWHPHRAKFQEAAVISDMAEQNE
jgi:hypothetical protein